MSNDIPAWVEGFNNAVGAYLVNAEHNLLAITNFGTPLVSNPERSKHIILDCSIAEVADVEQDVEQVSVFDSYDYNASRAASTISAKVSCTCGKYVQEVFSREATIGEIMYGVLNN